MSTKGKQSPKKGAGKLKEYGKGNNSKIKGSDISDSSGKECALSFPLLKTVDNGRMLPRYSAILNRTEDDGVGMEDLDALQLELEALLSAVVVRTRVLQVMLLYLRVIFYYSLLLKVHKLHICVCECVY